MSIANPLVLIADDDPDIRMLVRLRLQRAGYTVIAANDGLEALELAAGCDPDLAILDVSMPGLSGVEVTRALRGAAGHIPGHLADGTCPRVGCGRRRRGGGKCVCDEAVQPARARDPRPCADGSRVRLAVVGMRYPRSSR